MLKCIGQHKSQFSVIQHTYSQLTFISVSNCELLKFVQNHPTDSQLTIHSSKLCVQAYNSMIHDFSTDSTLPTATTDLYIYLLLLLLY